MDHVARLRSIDGSFTRRIGVPEDSSPRTGCEPIVRGGIARRDESSGEPTRRWVAWAWLGLGLGLGRRMLVEPDARAAELGHRRVILDTNLAPTRDESSGHGPIGRHDDHPDAQAWFAEDPCASERR